jgi:hypothetical protein
MARKLSWAGPAEKRDPAQVIRHDKHSDIADAP